MRRVKKGLAVTLTLVLVTAMMPFSQANVSAAMKMKLTTKNLTLTVGSKKKVKVKNAPKGVKVKWKSKNKKIAKVSKKGVITAVKAGKTVVTAKVGTKKLKCKVVVKAKPVSAPQTTKKPETPEAVPGAQATETTKTQNTTNAQSTTEQQTTAAQSTTKAQSTTAQPTTKATETTIGASTKLGNVEGLSYAGNENLPHYFAWAKANDVEGYHIFVNGNKIPDVTDGCVNLDASIFAAGGKFVIGVQAYKGNLVSDIATIEHQVAAVQTTKEVTTAQATTKEVTTAQATTKEVTTAQATTKEVTTAQQTTKEVTTQAPTTVQPTTQAGGEDIYANAEFLGDGAAQGALANTFKVVVMQGEASVVNVQKPNTITAIYTTYKDADIGNVTVNGKAYTGEVAGAGIYLNVDDFTKKDNEVVVYTTGGQIKAVLRVYNAKGNGDVQPGTTQPTTTQPTTQAQATTKAQATTQEQTTAGTATLDAVVGFTYAGNEAFPYHFAWATSNNVEGYHVYVNNQKVTDVTLSFVDLDAALFTKNGTYKIGVQAYKGSAVSPINTIDFVVTNGTDNPTQAQQTTQAATQAPTQQPTQAQIQPTTQAGGEDIYANAAFLGDGAAQGALANTFKVVVMQGEASVVNVQKPNTITAIYTTYKDADIGNVTVNGKAYTGEVAGAGIYLNVDDFTKKDNEVVVYTTGGQIKAVLRVYNAKGTGSTQEPTQEPTQAPTQAQTQPPTSAINFTTDLSISQPDGIVVSNPNSGMISVVWGHAEPNCFNVYVDGVRKKTKVSAAVYTIPVQSEGKHVVSVSHVNPQNNTESNRVDKEIYVQGTAPEETTALPYEDMPVIDESIQKQNGKIVLQMNNKTGGQYRDNQIYWIVVGRNPITHKIAYVDANGNLIEADLSDNDGMIGSRSYSQKIVHTLADNKAVQLPAIESGRMYISYGEPVYITFNGSDAEIGYAGPDTNNPGDANYHTLFEYIEFTTEAINGGITFHGNTTRVDFFSFPMITRLTDEYGGYDRCVGDLGTRAEIFNAYYNEVSDKFRTLITDERIMCPAKLTFGEGKQYGNYYDDYINRFWSKYANEDLSIDSEAGKFTGRVYGNRMIFTGTMGQKYYIDKPTTQDVLEGRGAFNRVSPETEAMPNGTDEEKAIKEDYIRCEKAIEAQLCAAFTRGIALDPSKWYKPSTFYPNNEIFNEYAAFFHRHSVSGKAYGFCYDDVADQSTLVECGNAARWVIDLKW